MKTRRLLSLFSILMALTLALPAWADSNVRIVRLSLVDGPVQLDRATGDGFERAIMNMPIAHGMALWTRDDSRAEIEFEEGNTIRVAPDSKVEFSELVLRTDGSRFTVVRIDRGRVYVNYSRKSGEDFRILIGNREIFLNKSAHFRVDVVGNRAEVAVFRGELNLDNDLRVKKNNSALLDLAGNGSFELAKGIAPALEDRWDEYRRDYHDKYARSAYNGSPFYGRSDLNYYGGWINSSYGSCWRPWGFDASWNPYSSGAWAWYPGYGYTFVSLYPWGWQPFRSGIWNFARGSGWCWSPGWNGYGYRGYGYAYAPMYNGPSGYVPVQPPTQPPTQVTGAPGGRGRLPLIPVGDVDTTTWRPTRAPRDGWQRDPSHRGETGGPVVSGGSVRSGGAASGSGTASTETRTMDRPGRSRDGAVMNRDLNPGRSSEATVNPSPRMERTPRDMQRDVQREQRQMQREQRGSDRSFDRSIAPSRPSPAPSAPAPQAAPSAPPPAAPAPAQAPATRGESRGAVPK